MSDAYPIHPYAELLPLHDGQTMWELREDIKAHGLVDDIVTYKGKVLDGRRRQACCLATGTEPRYVEFKGTDAEALAFVVSKNLKRRHLGEAERAMVAAKIAQLPKGRPVSGKTNNVPAGTFISEDAPAPETVVTRAEAAEMMNVSERAVGRARAVTDKGTEKLQDAVKDGVVTLTDAAKVAQEPPAAQDKAVDAVKNGKATTATKALPKPRAVKPPKVGKELFAWREYDAHLGHVARGPDALKRAYPGEEKSDEYRECVRLLEEFTDAWKKWQRRLSKAR